MPPERLEGVVKNIADVPINIIENTGKNKFDVAVRLNTRALERVISEIEKYKPAHLIYDIYVSTQAETTPLNLYSAVVCQTSKKYEVEVL